MLKWLAAKFRERSASPLARWSVGFDDDCIVTSDGAETTRRLPLGELCKVEVQTDDSGPCGADVVFYLFDDQPEPMVVFPLEARDAKPSWRGSAPCPATTTVNLPALWALRAWTASLSTRVEAKVRFPPEPDRPVRPSLPSRSYLYSDRYKRVYEARSHYISPSYLHLGAGYGSHHN